MKPYKIIFVILLLLNYSTVEAQFLEKLGKRQKEPQKIPLNAVQKEKQKKGLMLLLIVFLLKKKKRNVAKRKRIRKKIRTIQSLGSLPHQIIRNPLMTLRVHQTL